MAQMDSVKKPNAMTFSFMVYAPKKFLMDVSVPPAARDRHRTAGPGCIRGRCRPVMPGRGMGLPQRTRFSSRPDVRGRAGYSAKRLSVGSRGRCTLCLDCLSVTAWSNLKPAAMVRRRAYSVRRSPVSADVMAEGADVGALGAAAAGRKSCWALLGQKLQLKMVMRRGLANDLSLPGQVVEFLPAYLDSGLHRGISVLLSQKAGRSDPVLPDPP